MLFFSKLSKRLKNVWSIGYFSEVGVVDILLFLIVGPIFIVYNYIIDKLENFIWKLIDFSTLVNRKLIDFYTIVDRKLFSYRLEIMYYMGKYQNFIIYMDLVLRSLSVLINFYLHVNPSTLETFLDPFLKNLLKNFNLEIDIFYSSLNDNRRRGDSSSIPVSSEGERALIRRDDRIVSTSEGERALIRRGSLSTSGSASTSEGVVVTTSGPVVAVSVTSVELIPVERVPHQAQAQSQIQPLSFEHRERGISAWERERLNRLYRSQMQQGSVQQASMQQGVVQQASMQQGTVQQAGVQQGTVQQAGMLQRTVHQGMIQQGTVPRTMYQGMVQQGVVPGTMHQEMVQQLQSMQGYRKILPKPSPAELQRLTAVVPGADMVIRPSTTIAINHIRPIEPNSQWTMPPLSIPDPRPRDQNSPMEANYDPAEVYLKLMGEKGAPLQSLKDIKPLTVDGIFGEIRNLRGNYVQIGDIEPGVYVVQPTDYGSPVISMNPKFDVGWLSHQLIEYSRDLEGLGKQFNIEISRFGPVNPLSRGDFAVRSLTDTYVIKEANKHEMFLQNYVMTRLIYGVNAIEMGQSRLELLAGDSDFERFSKQYREAVNRFLNACNVKKW